MHVLRVCIFSCLKAIPITLCRFFILILTFSPCLQLRRQSPSSSSIKMTKPEDSYSEENQSGEVSALTITAGRGRGRVLSSVAKSSHAMVENYPHFLKLHTISCSCPVMIYVHVIYIIQYICRFIMEESTKPLKHLF